MAKATRLAGSSLDFQNVNNVVRLLSMSGPFHFPSQTSPLELPRMTCITSIFSQSNCPLCTFEIGLILVALFSTISNMKRSAILTDKRRILLDLSQIGFPEIPILGAYNLSAATTGLTEHAHPGVVEICYLKTGEQIYTVNGEDYLLKGNDIFITYPGERHGTGGNPEGKGMLYWVQLKIPTPQNTFLGLTQKDSNPLLHRLENFPMRHFQGTQQLQILFERVVKKYKGTHTNPLDKLSIAAALLEWLLIVIECSSHTEERTLSRDIEQIVELMNQDLEENRSMDDYAVTIHLSTSRFKAKFKEQVGVPPGEYYLRCKIENAKAQLKNKQKSITEIAYELGFSSSQYFATTFKRFENSTPKEYRNRK